MLMKTHSYMASNTELHFKLKKMRAAQTELGNLKRALDSSDSSVSTSSSQLLDEERMSNREREIRSITLNQEIDILAVDLTKSTVSFPNNITWLNFIDYMLIPTLVYELEYPRTLKYFNSCYFFSLFVYILT